MGADGGGSCCAQAKAQACRWEGVVGSEFPDNDFHLASHLLWLRLLESHLVPPPHAALIKMESYTFPLQALARTGSDTIRSPTKLQRTPGFHFLEAGQQFRWFAWNEMTT